MSIQRVREHLEQFGAAERIREFEPIARAILGLKGLKIITFWKTCRDIGNTLLTLHIQQHC